MELVTLMSALVLVCSAAFSFGTAAGERSERKEITAQCERIGQVIINDKVYECRLKEPPVRPTKGKVML